MVVWTTATRLVLFIKLNPLPSYIYLQERVDHATRAVTDISDAAVALPLEAPSTDHAT